MIEGILISLIAGVVGIAIGTFAAPTLSSLLLPHINPFGSSTRTFQGGFQPTNPGFGTIQASAVTPNPQLMLLALGAAVLLGTLGSLYPAWRAARIRPAEAMRYE
jgi:ABC-type antimicrobial peptide transport system permease subunit